MRTDILFIVKLVIHRPLKILGVWLSGLLIGIFLQLKWINDHCGSSIWNCAGPLAKDNMLRIFAGGPAFLCIFWPIFISCALFVFQMTEDESKNEKIIFNLSNVCYGLLLVVFSPFFRYSEWYYIFVVAVTWFIYFKSMKEFIIEPVKYHKYLIFAICIFISYEVLESADNVNFISGGKIFVERIIDGTANRILEPYAGMDGLPKPVALAIGGLREKSVPDYLPVGEFVGNSLFAQRIFEGAWPIKQTPGSKYRVGFSKDLKTIEKDYKIIWKKEDVGIAILKN